MRRKNILIIFIFCLLIIGGYYWYQGEQAYQSFLQTPVSPNAEKIHFTIAKGESAKEIASRLYQKKIIINEQAFTRYIKEKGLSSKIHSGPFILFPSETIPEIVKVLTGEKTTTIAIVIPEGFTIKQINKRLQEKGLIANNEFIECIQSCDLLSSSLESAKKTEKEGFLFPATYEIATHTFSVESFAQQLLQTFDKRISPYLKDIPDGKIYETIIMASLIEREASNNEERPIIAGILWKRLHNNWYLGVDATLRYYMDDWINPLTYQDLKDKNPYNTRTRLGLPPTPIANPGLASIKAAIYPTTTEYWYYLHDTEGNIHYAKTNEEHARNKVKYLYQQ